jgi:hypothetical protein
MHRPYENSFLLVLMPKKEKQTTALKISFTYNSELTVLYGNMSPMILISLNVSLGAHMQFLVGQPFSCMSDYHRII